MCGCGPGLSGKPCVETIEIDALFGRAIDPAEDGAWLERPGGEGASRKAGLGPAMPGIRLAVLLVIVAVNGKGPLARCPGPQLAQERNREEDPSIIRPAARAEERLPIAGGVAGTAAAHVAVGDAVDVVAVAVSGMHHAVWLMVVEIHIVRGDQAAKAAIGQKIEIVPLDSVRKIGPGLIMPQIRHGIAEFEPALVRSRRASVVRVGRNWTIGGVGANVLDDPVPRVRRMRLRQRGRGGEQQGRDQNGKNSKSSS